MIDQKDSPECPDTREALLENERLRAQLANAVEMSRLGPWEYDIANDVFTLNAHIYKVLGITAWRAGGYTMSFDE